MDAQASRVDGGDEGQEESALLVPHEEGEIYSKADGESQQNWPDFADRLGRGFNGKSSAH